MAVAALALDQTFTDALAEFEDIETSVGELAAYVSEVADGLSQGPDALGHALTAGWPDLATLLALRSRWCEARDALIAAWQRLTPSMRAATPLPPFGATDPTRPLI